MDKKMKELWIKIKKNLAAFFKSPIRDENKLLEEGKPEEIVTDEAMQKATKAFEVYALDVDDANSTKICDALFELLKINRDLIERLIEINQEEITYEEIYQLLKDEYSNIDEYKKTKEMRKIDNRFIFATYQVPIGIIAVKTNSATEAIANMIKAVVTKNAIIIQQKKENEYRIERLIQMLIQECLNAYKIDENIIQIIENQKVLNDVDLYIKDGKKKYKQEIETYYIYMQDEYFKENVQMELDRLKNAGKDAVLLIGEMNSAIQTINQNKTIASAIYTKDSNIGYKFINLVNADNVYVNATIVDARKSKEIPVVYYQEKNIVYEVGEINHEN